MKILFLLKCKCDWKCLSQGDNCDPGNNTGDELYQSTEAIDGFPENDDFDQMGDPTKENKETKQNQEFFKRDMFSLA